MIIAHRLNGKEFVVNCDLIKFVEATPDTVLTLLDGEKVMVRESVPDVLAAIKAYQRDLGVH